MAVGEDLGHGTTQDEGQRGQTVVGHEMVVEGEGALGTLASHL
jgi:hypothetical protein